MNILTFDIEEWALAKMRGNGSPETYAEFDWYLNQTLKLLGKRGFKATFFCTGMMAVEFPQVIKLIHSYGHEVGCHSHRHTWMNKLSEADAREDTHAAVDVLEQCIGQKIVSYRAPAFSIGESNKWMIEILAECGIERDASVFPVARDFGGFCKFGHKRPVTISHKGTQMKEFPICTTRLFGKELAYSGGGYFRFFPLWFVKKRMSESDYAMTYFHIADLMPTQSKVMSKAEYEDYFKEPGTLKNRYLRYLKSNIGKGSAFGKMTELIMTEHFVSLEQADQMINWQKVPSVVI